MALRFPWFDQTIVLLLLLLLLFCFIMRCS